MKAPMFTEGELRDLLAREEGQFLEFKSAWDRSGDEPRQVKRREVRDTIAEYVAAFANADGGLLLIGVEDDGSPTGHGYPDDVIEEFVTVRGCRLPAHERRAPRRALRATTGLARARRTSV